MTAPEAAALEFIELSKSFGSAVALDALTLRIPAGQFVTLFGPNGAGKTTLIRIAATLARASGGSVKIFGTETSASDAASRRRVGVVSHRTFLYPELTVGENLAFYGQLFGLDRLPQRVTAVARQVGLERRLEDPVMQLSRGLEQRCAIARALIHEPEILLLDEPFAGLDPVAGEQLEALLGEAHRAGRTIVTTSHDLSRGAALAQQVGVLYRGRLAFWGAPPDDIEHCYRECLGGAR